MTGDNSFDDAAWYLISYSNTLTFVEWRQAVKQAYLELEALYGTSSAMSLLNKMVAYYCLEIGGGYRGRQAISKFRKVHTWSDFRNSDGWWASEWRERRAFDQRVHELRKLLLQIPSVPSSMLEHDPESRESLSILMTEAEKRHGIDNLLSCEQVFRSVISIYGGHAIIALHERGILTSRARIPSLLSSYFLERALVEEFGDALLDMKPGE